MADNQTVTRLLDRFGELRRENEHLRGVINGLLATVKQVDTINIPPEAKPWGFNIIISAWLDLDGRGFEDNCERALLATTAQEPRNV